MKLSGPSKATTDHDTIREWVEERGGTPSHVKGTGRRGDLGMLRIDFPGFSGARTLEPVEWEEWLQAFDDNGLAFLYEERTKDGRTSRFNKLVSRDTVRTRQSRPSSTKRTSSRATSRPRTRTTRKTTTRKTTSSHKSPTRGRRTRSSSR